LALGAATIPSAMAQTLTTLYSFCSLTDCADGANPYTAGLVQGTDGNFYGVTYDGGTQNYGTFFQLTPGGTLTTLYNFCSASGSNCPDGANPVGLVQGADGNFYGVTSAWGPSSAYADGVMFRVGPSGGYSIVGSFCDTNAVAVCMGGGTAPLSPPIQGSDGNLYGTTSGGGNPYVQGTVYEFNLSSSAFNWLATFPCSPADCGQPEGGVYTMPDGSNPRAGLVQGTDGNFYGVTPTGTEGGATAFGVVFQSMPGGGLTNLHTFCSEANCADGAIPLGTLVQGTDGNFYGTTAGIVEPLGPSPFQNFAGTVFKITPSGTLTTLHTFCSEPNCSDGGYPVAGLILGSDGNFYGTTESGGAHGGGTTFQITSSGTLTTLYNFCSQANCADGKYPLAPLVQGTDGAFYGTTSEGGSSGSGTVFKLTLPDASVSLASLSFGDQVISTKSAAKTVTLTSTGQADLIISSITITGPNAGDFGESNTCTAASYAPGAKCTIHVTFTPSMNPPGAETATLTVMDNAASSQTVALSGTGIEPVTLSPTTLKFGNVGEASPSASKTIKVTNRQSVGLTITGITPSNPDYSESDDCTTAPIPAKGSCIITVTLTPSSLGADDGTLTVNDNASISPQATLTGKGVVQAAVSPTSLTFGSQTVGTTSTAKTVTLTNNLLTPLTIGSVSFTGANPGDYASPPNPCGGSVAANSHCTISVTFTPGATGTRTATMDINDGANNGPQSVALKGTGH
jgi:uncharacterized repeat protein (TIGR03803 family)